MKCVTSPHRVRLMHVLVLPLMLSLLLQVTKASGLSEPVKIEDTAPKGDLVPSPSKGDPASLLPKSVAGDEAPMPQKNGFAIGLFLGARSIVANPNVDTTIASGAVSGNIFLGYKVNRVIVGAFFELSHVSDSSHSLSGDKDTILLTSNTSFMVGPGTQVTFLSSKDSRVQLFGLTRILFGKTFSLTKNTPAVPEAYHPTVNEENFHISYQLAPGLRYRVHPQLAIVVVAGLSGDIFLYSQNKPSRLGSDTVNTLGVFASIGAMAIF